VCTEWPAGDASGVTYEQLINSFCGSTIKSVGFLQMREIPPLSIRILFILGKIQASFCQEQENVSSDLLITECQSVGIMLVIGLSRMTKPGQDESAY
jgi:hypothetical protein